MTTLTERLGYQADDRLAIVSADHLGTCHAANAGIYQSMRGGVVTTSALMMPAPWARHAMFAYRGEDIGVQLTLNAEHEVLRWGPLTHAPSLLDGDGGFPRTLTDLWDHADLDEVRRECRAQIERAIVWGFGITHLTSHLDALVFRPEFFDVYLDLACEFALPIRLGGPDAERAAGFPLRALALEEGIAMPDRVVIVSGGRDELIAAINACEPGVTELIVAPGDRRATRRRRRMGGPGRNARGAVGRRRRRRDRATTRREAHRVPPTARRAPTHARRNALSSSR